MASNTVSKDLPAAPVTPNVQTAQIPSELRRSIEGSLDVARDLNHLADWIGQARQRLMEVESAASNSTILSDGFRARGVAFSCPDWQNDLQGMGLFRVHRIIEESLRSIAIAVGLEHGDAS